MLIVIESDASVPSFLLSLPVELGPAVNKFELASPHSQRFSRSKKRGVLDPLVSASPELPRRFALEREALAKLDIELGEEEHWTSLVDHTTWMSAIVEALELAAEEDVMRLHLIDGRVLKCPIKEDCNGNQWGFAAGLEELTARISADFDALRSGDPEMVDEIVDEIALCSPDDGDSSPDQSFWAHGQDDENQMGVRAELLAIRKCTRSRLLDMLRRYVLPWLRALLPPTFYLWVLESAKKRSVSHLQLSARHLAQLCIRHLRCRTADELAAETLLWARAINCTALPSTFDDEYDDAGGSSMLRIGSKRKRMDDEMTAPGSEEQILSSEVDGMRLEDADVTMGDDLEGMPVALARDLLRDLAGLAGDSGKKGSKLPAKCYRPPYMRNGGGLRKLQACIASQKGRDQIADAHKQVSAQYEHIKELHHAIKTGREQERKRQEHMMGTDRKEDPPHRKPSPLEQALLRYTPTLEPSLLPDTSSLNQMRQPDTASDSPPPNKRLKLTVKRSPDLLPSPLQAERAPLAERSNPRSLSRSPSFLDLAPAIGPSPFQIVSDTTSMTPAQQAARFVQGALDLS